MHFEHDSWTIVSSFLHEKDLVRLSMTSSHASEQISKGVHWRHIIPDDIDPSQDVLHTFNEVYGRCATCYLLTRRTEWLDDTVCINCYAKSFACAIS